MDLVPREQTLYESSDGTLVVTTHRVRLVRKGVARTGRVTSVLLEAIDGVEYGRERRPIVLQLAVVALVLGVAAGFGMETMEAFVVLGVFPSLLLVAGYLVVRKRGLRIHAGRLTLSLPRFRGGVLAAESLIDVIERARLDRESAQAMPRPHFTNWRTNQPEPSSSEASSSG